MHASWTVLLNYFNYKFLIVFCHFFKILWIYDFNVGLKFLLFFMHIFFEFPIYKFLNKICEFLVRVLKIVNYTLKIWFFILFGIDDKDPSIFLWQITSVKYIWYFLPIFALIYFKNVLVVTEYFLKFRSINTHQKFRPNYKHYRFTFIFLRIIFSPKQIHIRVEHKLDIKSAF